MSVKWEYDKKIIQINKKYCLVDTYILKSFSNKKVNYSCYGITNVGHSPGVFGLLTPLPIIL